MRTKSFFPAFMLLMLLTGSSLFAQSKNQKPKLNQLGFYPEAPKIAVSPETDAEVFYIKEVESGDVVYEGVFEQASYYSPGDETVRIANFSDFNTAGHFVLETDGGERSHAFAIGDNIFDEVTDAVMKAYYFMRASTDLEASYAGLWARDAGHPDTNVIIHNSAAFGDRDVGSTISAPKGWYDAGDYNKYIVNSGISTYTLLLAYEKYPEFFDSQNLNIPESLNNYPDILDEVRWNLEWMMEMQDPQDGGVYHKLTHANFTGIIMPREADNIARYVVQKTSAAAFNFAAVMAQAARVYAPYDPEFSNEALAAAEYAWQWGVDNPEIYYNQEALSNPEISTGAYGDNNTSDEQFWASTELYITTENEDYYDESGWMDNPTPVPSWNSVGILGLYSLNVHRADLTEIAIDDTTDMRTRLMDSIHQEFADYQDEPYRSPHGIYNSDFFWGSNSQAANLGMAYLLVYEMTGLEGYYNAAIHSLDYLLGRNSLDFSYVTGYGEKSPMHIHHRPSEADGVEDPVPGLLAGGPNRGQQDGCNYNYSDRYGALSYIDDWCSYASNEITINWNAPLVYLLSGLQSLTPETGKVVSSEEQGSLIPEQFELKQNYPNPFNPTTQIEFSLSKPAFANLSVYDMTGRKVRELLNEQKNAGKHMVQFDASQLSSGTYIYTLETPEMSESRTMVLIK